MHSLPPPPSPPLPCSHLHAPSFSHALVLSGWFYPVLPSNIVQKSCVYLCFFPWDFIRTCWSDTQLVVFGDPSLRLSVGQKGMNSLPLVERKPWIVSTWCAFSTVYCYRRSVSRVQDSFRTSRVFRKWYRLLNKSCIYIFVPLLRAYLS